MKMWQREPELRSALDDVDAVLVPGGFGKVGLEAMVACLREAREAGMPTLGICLGMQLMVVEWMRYVVGNTKAVSEEWEAEKTTTRVPVTLRPNVVVGLLEGMDTAKLGGTMRLGSHPVALRHGSQVHALYNHQSTTDERHRHRYEVQPKCVPALEESGLRVSGHRDGVVEVVERADASRPLYVGCQFHPEYTSSPFAPHPLVVGWLRAAVGESGCEG